MEVTSTTAGSTTYENPKAKLGNEEFLQLFLTELKYQDPTEPMENEKILTQTSQLSTLESNQAMQDTLEKLATQMGGSNQFSMVSAIGKMANTGYDSLNIQDGSSAKFDIYFDEPIESGNISIYDSSNRLIKNIDLSEKVGESGNLNFNWDATNSSGSKVTDGIYKVIANYNGDKKSNLGVYPIESVKFDSGEAYLKVANNYVAANDVVEIFQ